MTAGSLGQLTVTEQVSDSALTTQLLTGNNFGGSYDYSSVKDGTDRYDLYRKITNDLTLSYLSDWPVIFQSVNIRSDVPTIIASVEYMNLNSENDIYNVSSFSNKEDMYVPANDIEAFYDLQSALFSLNYINFYKVLKDFHFRYDLSDIGQPLRGNLGLLSLSDYNQGVGLDFFNLIENETRYLWDDNTAAIDTTLDNEGTNNANTMPSNKLYDFGKSFLEWREDLKNKIRAKYSTYEFAHQFHNSGILSEQELGSQDFFDNENVVFEFQDGINPARNMTFEEVLTLANFIKYQILIDAYNNATTLNSTKVIVYGPNHPTNPDKVKITNEGSHSDSRFSANRYFDQPPNATNPNSEGGHILQLLPDVVRNEIVSEGGLNSQQMGNNYAINTFKEFDRQLATSFDFCLETIVRCITEGQVNEAFTSGDKTEIAPEVTTQLRYLPKPAGYQASIGDGSVTNSIMFGFDSTVTNIDPNFTLSDGSIINLMDLNLYDYLQIALDSSQATLGQRISEITDKLINSVGSVLDSGDRRVFKWTGCKERQIASLTPNMTYSDRLSQSSAGIYTRNYLMAAIAPLTFMSSQWSYSSIGASYPENGQYLTGQRQALLHLQFAKENDEHRRTLFFAMLSRLPSGLSIDDGSNSSMTWYLDYYNINPYFWVDDDSAYAYNHDFLRAMNYDASDLNRTPTQQYANSPSDNPRYRHVYTKPRSWTSISNYFAANSAASWSNTSQQIWGFSDGPGTVKQYFLDKGYIPDIDNERSNGSIFMELVHHDYDNVRQYDTTYFVSSQAQVDWTGIGGSDFTPGPAANDTGMILNQWVGGSTVTTPLVANYAPVIYDWSTTVISQNGYTDTGYGEGLGFHEEQHQDYLRNAAEQIAWVMGRWLRDSDPILAGALQEELAVFKAGVATQYADPTSTNGVPWTNNLNVLSHIRRDHSKLVYTPIFHKGSFHLDHWKKLLAMFNFLIHISDYWGGQYTKLYNDWCSTRVTGQLKSLQASWTYLQPGTTFTMNDVQTDSTWNLHSPAAAMGTSLGQDWGSMRSQHSPSNLAWIEARFRDPVESLRYEITNRVQSKLDLLKTTTLLLNKAGENLRSSLNMSQNSTSLSLNVDHLNDADPDLLDHYISIESLPTSQDIIQTYKSYLDTASAWTDSMHPKMIHVNPQHTTGIKSILQSVALGNAKRTKVFCIGIPRGISESYHQKTVTVRIFKKNSATQQLYYTDKVYAPSKYVDLDKLFGPAETLDYFLNDPDWDTTKLFYTFIAPLQLSLQELGVDPVANSEEVKDMILDATLKEYLKISNGFAARGQNYKFIDLYGNDPTQAVSQDFLVSLQDALPAANLDPGVRFEFLRMVDFQKNSFINETTRERLNKSILYPSIFDRVFYALVDDDEFKPIGATLTENLTISGDIADLNLYWCEITVNDKRT